MEEEDIDADLLESILEEDREAAELAELDDLGEIDAGPQPGTLELAEALVADPPTGLRRLSELLSDRIVEINKTLEEGGRKIVLTLREPMALTVARNDGLLRRESMIGGEEFTLFAADTTKSEQALVWLLQPSFIANYNAVHLNENDAIHMGGMNRWTHGHLADILKERNELRQEAAAERERALIASREEYKGIEQW